MPISGSVSLGTTPYATTMAMFLMSSRIVEPLNVTKPQVVSDGHVRQKGRSTVALHSDGGGGRRCGLT